jgi:putative ABC transport system permease protein
MMFLGINTWLLGAKSLLLHPLRSSLTVLGIFIGVASVVWLLAIGEGISRKAQEQIEGLGADNIIIRSLKPPAESTQSSSSTSRSILPYGLTRRDFDRLSGTMPTVLQAIPIRESPRQQFRYSDRVVEGRLVGCTPEYKEVTRLEEDRGQFISDAHMRDRKNVCALAAEVAERLFPIEDPIGRSIHVGDHYYVVVGVMKPRGSTAAIGGSLAAQDFRSDVYVPISTFWARLGDVIFTQGSGSFEGEMLEISQITLRVDKVANVMDTAEMVEDLLSRAHRNEDYGITVPLELLEQARTTRMMFIVFMGLIAAISLVVGGIGIMNIMLATVTERTREIGIRRALGAKRGHITMQFLAETVLLSIAGGVIGILGGLACPAVVTRVRDALVENFPDHAEAIPELIREIEPVVVGWSIPLAFGISVAVGVIFGLYPAIRAALMDPVEALRHE